MPIRAGKYIPLANTRLRPMLVLSRLVAVNRFNEYGTRPWESGIPCS